MDDGQQDDDDEEEEGNVKDDAVHFVGVPGRVFNFIADATSSSHSHVHVEQVTLGKKNHGDLGVSRSVLFVFVEMVRSRM